MTDDKKDRQSTASGGSSDQSPKRAASGESREERLSAALRANLKRRKAQARSRKTNAAGDTNDTA